MKLPVIRHIQRNNTVDKIESCIEVLESFSEYNRITDEELDVVGELITNLCGAVEVNKMIAATFDATKFDFRFRVGLQGLNVCRSRCAGH